MKPLYKKISQLALSSVIIMLVTSTSALADSTSASFSLDFDGITTGSQKSTSSSFVLQSGPLPIEVNSDSSNYKLVTLNYIPNVCGNGIVEVGENCDSGDLNGHTCSEYGFDTGTVSCTATCTVNTSSCSNSGGGGGGGGGHTVPYEEYKEIINPTPDVTPDVTPDPPQDPIDPEPPVDPILEFGDNLEIDNNFKLPTQPKTIYVVEPQAQYEPLVIDPVYSIEKPDEIIELALPKLTYDPDNTPLVIHQLLPKTEYQVIVYDRNGRTIEANIINTDNNGQFVYETFTHLDNGQYNIRVVDKLGYVVKTFPFNIKKQNGNFKVTSFADQDNVTNSFDEIIDLGQITRNKATDLMGRLRDIEMQNMFIQGYGLPNTKIIIIFESEVIQKETTTDEKGFFQIKIPDELELGPHFAYIYEEYANGSKSRNLTYKFELIAEQTNQNFIAIISIVLGLIFSFVFAVCKCRKNRKKKCVIKKTLSKLLIIALLITSSPVVETHANIPNIFLYEGRLQDNTGADIVAAHTFRFSLWSVSDKIIGDTDVLGAINTAAPAYGGWQEEHTVTPASNGTFSIELGSITPLPDMDFNDHQFLQVEIKANGAGDTLYELMDPTGDDGADADDRKKIGSLPYAKRSETAEHSDEEIFILDKDNTISDAGTGNIKLQFGGTLNHYLQYNIDDGVFEFSDDIRLLNDKELQFRDADLTINSSVDGQLDIDADTEIELDAPIVDITGNITMAPGNTVDGVDISELTFDDIKTRVKELVFIPEYNGAVIEKDGSDNRGKLSYDFIDLGGLLKKNFYHWTTRQVAIQDIDLVISYVLPPDFTSFTATPLSVDYRTSDGVIATNHVDIALYDSNGNAVVLTGGSALANAAFTTEDITFGGAPVFTAGSTITFVIKLSTIDTGFAEVSDIHLQFNGK